MKSASTIRFSAAIGPQGLLALPATAHAKLPLEKTAIEGTINSFPFKAALEADGKSGAIKISKAMNDAAKLGSLETVAVEITRIGDEPEIRVPADFRKALSSSPKALAQWEDITPLARRDWIFWMISAKQAETRARRIENGCDMLASGKRRVCCFAGVQWITKSGFSIK